MPSLTANELRHLANEQRGIANRSDLPMVRARHQGAAERLDALAEELERCEPAPGDMPRLFR
jgi:hypothetical protein